MRLKRAFSLVGSLLVVVLLFMVYSSKDLNIFPNRKSSIEEDLHANQFLHFEDRIKQLEKDLSRHHETVDELKSAMKNMIQPSSSTSSVRNISKLKVEKPDFPVSLMLYDLKCPIQVDLIPRTNIQMLELYKAVSFDNIDGGVWKQGWQIEVDEKEWNKANKLKVFVVPHSHNDPGWLKTVEDYYVSQTKHILSNMLTKLPEDSRRKFIWAEISYFSMWWDDLNEEEREIVKKLIQANQLEIVSGGWVMNDEANSHWISTMLQYTDGHQWLHQYLNYTPKSSWSIDPFGLSATQAALLKEMDFENMLIQRVHYIVKKQLATQKQLEFRWRQLWDSNGKSDIFTQVMPFYSYDIPHTCGPDPKICCQFDFKRLPSHGLYCPWKVPPQPITEKNVAERAEMLLDQYRKKSKLFKTRILLVPLGDDFRYSHPTEWDVQYNNYQMLFDYMNSNLHLNVHAQFGTLSNYFDAVRKEMEISQMPVLSGDFFTYADRDDHYWSGYYTSRPFYKRMDRVLLSYVRAADALLTLAHLMDTSNLLLVDKQVGLGGVMGEARKALSLFQHHDGITGTAKDHVVIDYAKRMLSAINGCQKVLQVCTQMLLSSENVDLTNKDALYYNIDDVRHNYNSLDDHYPIMIGPELRTKKIVIFNSLTFTRHEIVSFYVSTAHVEVLDYEGRQVQCQISPVIEYTSSMSQTKYLLTFIANVPALSLVTYTVNAMLDNEISSATVFASVKVYNHYGDVQPPQGFSVEVLPSSAEFTLQNSRITASFSKVGLLKAVKVGTYTVPVHLEFVRYGVDYRQERSGAYLFLPDGEARPVQITNTVVNVVQGPIISSVMIQLPYVHHTVTLYNTPGADGLGVEIKNIVDISKTSNFELAMRLSTNIKNDVDFFTDLNGFQMLRRRRLAKLPLQANYYPIPTMAYIEDDRTRMSLITGSPLGCSSLKEGSLEVMLDRRLNQDDNLGLGQGVNDNQPTRHVFRLLFEKKTHTCQATAADHPAGFPSLSSHVATQTLLNPLVKLLRTEDYDTQSKLFHISIEDEFGVDFSMPSLRTGVLINGKDYVGLVVHRQMIDVCFTDRILLKQFPLSDGKVNLSKLLKLEAETKLWESSLTFLSLKNKTDIRKSINMCPMEVQAYVLAR